MPPHLHREHCVVLVDAFFQSIRDGKSKNDKVTPTDLREVARKQLRETRDLVMMFCKARTEVPDVESTDDALKEEFKNVATQYGADNKPHWIRKDYEVIWMKDDPLRKGNAHVSTQEPEPNLDDVPLLSDLSEAEQKRHDINKAIIDTASAIVEGPNKLSSVSDEEDDPTPTEVLRL
ncbi:uncharacterized protein JN550_012459 [Neoarthrinium moseri]|uniref:uncharacterized protein n=1 Tax=Neoarthrinium moseri TaxID=1658444 RepID=UPI001FDE9DDA|nr:uncharacterized protein JN550_012459 [Neoarthrinium moseri]KAI1858805.1 hypothetical protein JN550_012459 [Neoarthrinium moseri]